MCSTSGCSLRTSAKSSGCAYHVALLSVFWVFAVFFSFSFPLSLAWPQREQAEASESRKLAEAEAREAREAIEKAQAEAADVAAAQIQMDREQMEADLILAAGEDHKVPKRVRKSGGYVGPLRALAPPKPLAVV